MVDKKCESFEINFKLTVSSREAIRHNVVNAFLKEKAGYWKSNVQYVTRYKYFVETLSDGRRVYLLRPTFLNKGIDFQVWVERLEDNEDKRPSHKDIFKDLKAKKRDNLHEYEKLIDPIKRVHMCEEPDNVLEDYSFNFTIGYSPELLLKIIKWLFIEQDITYWNYDGRDMLKKAILEV